MQEEEAALLSMGPVLIWRVNVPDEAPLGFEQEISEHHTKHSRQKYVVGSNPKTSPRTSVNMISRKSDGYRNHERQDTEYRIHIEDTRWYHSIAEAKAACEVHAATGNFPPSLKSGLPLLVDKEHSDEGHSEEQAA